MYTRIKQNINRFTPKPHFKETIGNGFQIRPDAPEIDPNLSKEMFSLSVNKLNGRNIQPVTLEESNRLASVASLDVVATNLDTSIQDYQKQQQEEKDYQEYLKQKETT